jgi:hypothetical protein
MSRPSHPPGFDHSNYTWKKRTHCEATCCVVFSTLPSLHPSLVHIFSSAPCLSSSLFVRDKSSTTIQNQKKNYSLVVPSFTTNFLGCLFIYTCYHYKFRPLLAILRQNMQLNVGSYCTYNGSVVMCAL